MLNSSHKLIVIVVITAMGLLKLETAIDFVNHHLDSRNMDVAIDQDSSPEPAELNAARSQTFHADAEIQTACFWNEEPPFVDEPTFEDEPLFEEMPALPAPVAPAPRTATLCYAIIDTEGNVWVRETPIEHTRDVPAGHTEVVDGNTVLISGGSRWVHID